MKRVFGEAARRTPMSSIKSMIGHTMGAASAIEAAVCALAVAEDRIPPTMNLEEPEERPRLRAQRGARARTSGWR